jgi:serine/threonine-protein kinase
MLEKNPARRYASARDVLIDLRRAQQGENPVFALGAAEDGVGERKHQTKFKFSKKIQIALAAAVILVAALVGWSVLRHNSSSSQTGTSAGPTVGEKAATLVVLPFDAVSEDPKLTAFGNGLVDTLTAKLMQLGENHPVQVVSASEMRQKNVGTLARARQEFGANTGLHLALQQSDDLVRVTYSLTDGRTGKVLKAETIDAPVTDPFSIENRVAKGVASALGFELRPDEARELAFHGTSNPDAYNYYTQALGYLEDQSKTENVNSAIILLTQALKTDPNYGRAEADLGSAYWTKYESSKDKTSISKSQQACKKAVDLGNSGAAGHVCLGTIASGTGKYEEAAAQFQHAAQLEGTNEYALLGLGGAYEHLGKRQDAENAYKKIVQLRPNYYRGYNHLGIFYLRQAQYDDATRMFRKQIELTPESDLGYLNLGATFLYQGKYAEATQPLERALAIRPSPLTYSNLGYAYFYQHRFKDSTAAYEKAVQLDDKDYLSWGSLAQARYFAGERETSRQAYDRAIALAKNAVSVNARDVQALKYLADYHAMIGDRNRAISYLNEELNQSRSDQDALFEAALVFNHLGETGTSLEWLGKALRAGVPPQQVLQEPGLDNLHDNPRFQELLKSSSSGPNPGK